MSDVHVRLSVGGESYALPVGNVLEVAELGELATVPGAGPSVLGVRNLRGHVLPVVDLAAVFGIARTGEPARLLVAEHEGKRVGLAIDDVSDVATLPDVHEDSESEFLRGAVLDDGELVGVVDIGRVFAAIERESRL